MKRDVASYKAVSNARYPDNTTGLIDAPVDRADKNDIADSFLNYKSPDVMAAYIDMGGYGLVNVVNPTNPQDAATKAYVDASSLYRVVTVAVTFAELLECGSSPKILLNASGDNNITNSVVGITAKFIYGTVEYDFVSVVMKNATGTIQFFLNDDLNSLTNFFKHYTRQGNEVLANEDFILTTEDASDPSQGDGGLILKIYYTIEDFN